MLRKLKFTTELVNVNTYHYHINPYFSITHFSELKVKSIPIHLLYTVLVFLFLMLLSKTVSWWVVSFKISCTYFFSLHGFHSKFYLSGYLTEYFKTKGQLFAVLY